MANHHQLFEDLIVTALEGGSNYWYHLGIIRDGLEEYKDENKLYLSEAVARYALQDYGVVPIYDYENPEDHLGDLTKESMYEAFKIMKRDYDQHYWDARSENWDADTADVFFQLAVMGEIVFG